MAKNQDNTENEQNENQAGQAGITSADQITMSKDAFDMMMQSVAAAFAGGGNTTPAKKAHRVIVDKYDGRAWKETELVTLHLDSDKHNDDLYVSVNGRRHLVRRGEEVLVPKAVAEVIKESVKQDERAARMIKALVAQRRTL